MNTSKKGYLKEAKAKKELIEDGWLIPFQSVRTRWATYDFADYFDVLAFRGKERKFISCKHFGKSNYYKQHQEEIRKFKDEYGLPGESYELWIWKSARYEGRGKNKSWVKAQWIKISIY